MRTMRVVISGSRSIRNRDIVDAVVDLSGWRFQIAEIVTGDSGLVDFAGRSIAVGMGVIYTAFPADWEGYGLAAGPIRNSAMADYADALIAIWDGKSKGTRSMIDQMTKRGKPVFLCTVGLQTTCTLSGDKEGP